jgi:biotin carboxyl carrier protein
MNFKINNTDQVIILSETDLEKLDIVETLPNQYNIIKNSKSVNCKVLEANFMEKTYSIEVDGEVFDLQIKSPLEQQLEAMGFETNTKKLVKEILAPMPGLVLEISVKAGESVNEGDKLIILEAMKMENVIKSPITGEILEVLVNQSEAVDKGQILIKFL